MRDDKETVSFLDDGSECSSSSSIEDVETGPQHHDSESTQEESRIGSIGTSATSTIARSSSCCFESSSSSIKSLQCLEQETRSRTILLRTLLIISLLAAVTICTCTSYTILRESEREMARQNFESVAASALVGAQAIALRKFQGSEVMSTLFSHTHPNADQWPLGIEFDGYVPVSKSVARLGSSTTQSLMVFLDPSDEAEFESHVKDTYSRQGRSPETAGVSDFGFGVWNPDPNRPSNCEFDDCRIHASSSPSTRTKEWNSKLNVETPLMFHNERNSKSLLFNVYAQEDRGIHIEAMDDCVKNAINENNNKGMAKPSCAVVTDILQLAIRPGPAALIFNPIFPANDPTTLVGFATTSVQFKETLESIVPDYVNGLTCVVSTDTTSVTYEIRKGQPIFVGDGDLHDPKYDHLQRSIHLNEDLRTNASTSAKYTLTVYPTDEMFQTFVTNNPTRVAIGFFGVVAFCTCVFFLYDYLMRHEAHQRRTILEMKRRFIRFVSHEIRTPLNTVFLGLELLQSELEAATTRDGEAGVCIGESCVDSEDIGFWSNIATDIKENAHTAVEILNDMLNYDKLENGDGFNLELSQVRIADVVVRTVRQFQIQAINRHVNLSLHIDDDVDKILDGATSAPDSDQSDKDTLENSSRSTSSNNWTVIGDDVRLGQVMRNLISNALKFTPAGGNVEVSAQYVPNGLSDVKSLCLAKDKKSGKCAFSQKRLGSVRIEIKDTGIGLTKNQLRKLFGEGIQFDANKLQHGGGSGLGLNIAKGIIEQHSGTIVAQSYGQGHGTTFIIELPLYQFVEFGSGRYKDDRTFQTASITDRSSRDDSSAPYLLTDAPPPLGASTLSECSRDETDDPRRATPNASLISDADDPMVSTSFVIADDLTCEERTPCSSLDIKDNILQEDDLQKSHLTTKVIPMDSKAAMKIDIATPAFSSETEEVGSFRIRRVLVVEDVTSSLKMLMRILKRAGHECEGAENGKVAIEKMEADFEAKRKNPDTHIAYDTILMDFEMPIVNGPTATTRIRQMGFTGSIVGVTGNVLSEDIQFFRNAGANEVLAKPISMKRIDGYWAKEEAASDDV